MNDDRLQRRLNDADPLATGEARVPTPVRLDSILESVMNTQTPAPRPSRLRLAAPLTGGVAAVALIASLFGTLSAPAITLAYDPTPTIAGDSVRAGAVEACNAVAPQPPYDFTLETAVATGARASLALMGLDLHGDVGVAVFGDNGHRVDCVVVLANGAVSRAAAIFRSGGASFADEVADAYAYNDGPLVSNGEQLYHSTSINGQEFAIFGGEAILGASRMGFSIGEREVGTANVIAGTWAFIAPRSVVDATAGLLMVRVETTNLVDPLSPRLPTALPGLTVTVDRPYGMALDATGFPAGSAPAVSPSAAPSGTIALAPFFAYPYSASFPKLVTGHAYQIAHATASTPVLSDGLQRSAEAYIVQVDGMSPADLRAWDFFGVRAAGAGTETAVGGRTVTFYRLESDPRTNNPDRTWVWTEGDLLFIVTADGPDAYEGQPDPGAIGSQLVAAIK